MNSVFLSREFGYHYRKGNRQAGTEKYYDSLPDKMDFIFYKKFGQKNNLNKLYFPVMNVMLVNLFWDYVTRHHYFHKDNPDSFRKQVKEINLLLKGECTKDCYFPIAEAMECANKNQIKNRIMRFLVKYRIVSAMSLYIGSRISLLKQKTTQGKRRK